MRPRLRPTPPSLADLERWAGERPDSNRVVAEALEPLRRNTLSVAGLLISLAALGPWFTGSLRAALLPGVPGAVAGLCALLAGSVMRRRVALVLATGCIGLLAFGSLGALLGLERLGERGPLFQLACLAVTGLHLVPAWPAWRRSAREGDVAAAVQAMHDELSR